MLIRIVHKFESGIRIIIIILPEKIGTYAHKITEYNEWAFFDVGGGIFRKLYRSDIINTALELAAKVKNSHAT